MILILSIVLLRNLGIKKDNVYDLSDWSEVSDKIKSLSMTARINCQKQPTFVFYF